MRDISPKIFWIVLISLVLLRIIMVFLLMQDIPPTGVKLDGWWFYHGGDENTYFSFAKSIADFNIAKAKAVIGYPLFLAPFIFFTEAQSKFDILKPIFIIYAFLFFSLSIVLVGLIAKKISQSRIVGSICAGIFACHPYLFYLFFHDLGPYYEGIGYRGVMAFQHLHWLQINSDPLSAFLVYLCFFLFFFELSKNNPRKSILMLLGILSGFSALVRVGNLLIIGLFILGWLMRKKLKEAVLMASFSFFTLLPQFIYNHIFFGFPWRFAYEAYYQVEQGQGVLSMFSLSRWLHLLERAYFYIPEFLYLLPVLILLFILGARYLLRRNRIAATILILWFFAYLIFYGSFGFGGFQPRFFIPALPPIILLIVCSFFSILPKSKKLSMMNNRNYAQ